MQGLRIFRSHFFRNLFASYCAVLLVTAFSVALLVDHRLQEDLVARLQATLVEESYLLAPLATDAFAERSPAEPTQRVLETFRHDTGLRITLIRNDGSVLADSDEDPRMMENHSGRAEILEAMENEIGIAKRHSRTVGIPMLYVARRIERDGQTSGILRIAVPIDEVEARTASTQKSIAIGTAAGLAFALLLGLFLARRFTRPIAEMTRVADDMRAGRYESRVRLHQQDEIGVLAETLNSLGREVTRRIATISQDDAQLRAMLAGMVEGVIAVEEDDTIGFCNAAARDLLGIVVDRPEGLRLWELAPVAELEELLEEARSSNAMSRREVILMRSGRERTVDVHASPFRGGDRSGLVLVLHDISELRRLERIRRDFVANVSHELKTPLTSIKGFVETLLAGALHDEHNNERFLRRIDWNVDRLTHLVPTSSASRASSPAPRSSACPSTGAMLTDVLRRHEEAIRSKGLALEVRRAARPCCACGRPRGDDPGARQPRRQRGQVHDATGDPPAARHSRGHRRGLIVEDSGHRHPERRARPRLRALLPRRQGPLARGRRHGPGAFDREAPRHGDGGTVRVASDVGRGSRFTVDLPAAVTVALASEPTKKEGPPVAGRPLLRDGIRSSGAPGSGPGRDRNRSRRGSSPVDLEADDADVRAPVVDAPFLEAAHQRISSSTAPLSRVFQFSITRVAPFRYQFRPSVVSVISSERGPSSRVDRGVAAGQLHAPLPGPKFSERTHAVERAFARLVDAVLAGEEVAHYA